MSKERTFFHVTPSKNIDSILKNGLIPQIGPRSKSADESENKTFLFGSYADAEDAILNWLGEELEDEKISVLELQIHEEECEIADGSFEWSTKFRIPPEKIKVIRNE